MMNSNSNWLAIFALLATSSVIGLAQSDTAKDIFPIITYLLDADNPPDNPPSYSPLNDTGIYWGVDYPSGNNSSCTSNLPDPQDCDHGRDAWAYDPSDGYAGFSYTKISNTGTPLPAGARGWSCVKDNVTGLTWEAKRDDGGIHDKDNAYRWGGKTALGSGYGTYYNDWDVLVDGSNSESLCGFSDWRVPNMLELRNLMNHAGVPTKIDLDYFPNTGSVIYWSSTPSALDSGEAWNISFFTAKSFRYGREYFRYVRLVRGGQ